MSSQIIRDRIVIYKPCRYHDREFAQRVDAGLSDCTDCRRATFRASMKARGITVTIPSYKGVKGTPNGYTGHYGTPSSFLKPLREPGVFAFPERFPWNKEHPRSCDCLDCVSKAITAEHRQRISA